MKAYFVGVIAIMLFAQIVGLGPIFGLFATHEDDISELLPPVRSPLYLPGERQTAMALVIHDECLAAANDARQTLHNVSTPQAEYGGYLDCYVGKMLEKPQQLCDADTRHRLVRYTRGYFGLLAGLKRDDQAPALQGMLKMERQMETRSNIETGKDDYSPDPHIIEGWKTLVADGAFAKDRELSSQLKPEVSSSVIDALTAIKPAKAICP